MAYYYYFIIIFLLNLIIPILLALCKLFFVSMLYPVYYMLRTEDCSQLSGSSKFVPAPECVLSPDIRPVTGQVTAPQSADNPGYNAPFHLHPRGQHHQLLQHSMQPHLQDQPMQHSVQQPHLQQYTSHHQSHHHQQQQQQAPTTTGFSNSHQSSHHLQQQQQSLLPRSHLSAHQASHQAAEHLQSGRNRVAAQQRGRTVTRHTITPAASSPKVI